MEGLGKALESQIRTARPPKSRKGALVLNTRIRILIYKEVVERPGVTVPEIARALDKGETTVRWHLHKMEKAGVVRSEGIDGRMCVIPGTVYPADVLERILLLRSGADQLLRAIEKEPGLTQGELAERSTMGRKRAGRLLHRMGSTGLVRIVKDGPSLRHFPAEGLNAIRSDLSSVSRDIRDRLAQVLHSEVPDIYSLSTKGERLVLEGPFGIITFSTDFQ